MHIHIYTKDAETSKKGEEDAIRKCREFARKYGLDMPRGM